MLGKIKQGKPQQRVFHKAQQRSGGIACAVRAKHQAHLREAFEKLFPHLLGHASAHGHQHIGVGGSQFLNAPKQAHNFLHRLCPHRAGVYNIYAGLAFRGWGKSSAGKGAFKPCRLVDVHLTAKSYNIVCFLSHSDLSAQPGRARRLQSFYSQPNVFEKR